MFRQKHTVRKIWLWSLAGIVLVSVSGCVQPVDNREVRFTTAPTEAVDSALTDKDAANVYEIFLRTSDLVLADGGASPERMKEYAASDALDEFLADAKDFETRGWSLVGSTRFDSISVQTSSASEISFYVCDDVSETDLLDETGKSLVEPDRVNRSPWLVSASRIGGDSKVVSKELWVGENFC